MNDKDSRKEKRQKRGLYFALAVCLVAVAVAGWSTYSGVVDYLSQKSEVSESSEELPTESEIIPELPKEQEETVNTDPEKVESISEEPDVPENIPESEEESAVPEETEDPETVDAPLYTPSEKLIFQSGELLLPYSAEPAYNETMGDWRSHFGADISMEAGETVKALGNGIVKQTGSDLLYGNYIVIEHGEYVLRYCGLGDTLLVEKDQVVTQGMDIGSVSTVPFEAHEESHIHLELSTDSGAIDPMTVIAAE